MWTFITCIYAENIVDAEFKLQSYMQQGNEYTEYIITRTK